MEMSRRDVRRGGVTNRFSNKLSRKLKKGMLKKLGLADVDDNMNHEKKEMMISNEFPASGLENNVFKKKKKSRLPKNVTHGVDHHASVPRKLRSAMKKRNVESVSASKKLNRSRTGIESFNIDLVKKENQDAKAAESISKDEKEVAETLYGLADMFTDTNSIDKNTCDPLLSDGKETSKVDSTLVVETECTTRAESLEPTTSFLSSSKPKQIDEEPLQQHHNQCSLTGLKQSSSVNEPVSTKPTLLNLLSSTKLPHWMIGQAVSPTKNASLLSEPLRVRPRNLKRCASHFYICRLIKLLQSSKSSPVALLNQTEERSLEMSQCRLPDPVTIISDFNTMVAPSKSYQSSKLVQENMTQLSLELYAPHIAQKQNCDFLSLSCSGEAQSHLPLPNLFPQYPISASHNNQQQMQQMSPYLASRFQTAYNANHQQQQQQLQKRLWAAQYRPPRSRNTVPPLSNQYSKPNLCLNQTSIQPLHIASSPRYINNVSQQPHRVMAAAAAMSRSQHHNNNHLRTVMNRREHHLPLIYEDTRTPLQLLCSEQL
ncbi:hypothetical protein Bca101_057111 [Brassica carinata]